MAQHDALAPAAPTTGVDTALADDCGIGPAPGIEPSPDAWLEHDRLDAYRVSLDFQQLAARPCRGRGLGALRDQLDRASVSV